MVLESAMRYRFNSLLLFSMLVLLIPASCNSVDAQPEAADELLVPCPASRPEVCTMIYAPVCHRTNRGERGISPSACAACARIDVVGYSEGECAPSP
ncbi:MAG: hypothetical protein KDI19_00695 [Pseudomonadales bacterium]|nr:hypothetical protein [Pseudomonadales bacterium]